MAYYQQQTINEIFESAKKAIDDMFPVKSESTPEPSAAVFCEKWTDHRGDVADWLREMPAPVSDANIVSFVRVTKTMGFQGRRLHRSKPKRVPDGVDAHAFIQEFCDRCGGGMEAYNADGAIVAKFVPTENLKPGRAFI